MQMQLLLFGFELTRVIVVDSNSKMALNNS